MTAVISQLKTWAAPLLAAAVLTLLGYLFTEQQQRISGLESQVASSQVAFATITENQRQGAADRSQFQENTTKRLDAMSDVLVKMGLNIERLTTIQEQSMRR